MLAPPAQPQDDEAPHVVGIPAEQMGLVIGQNGSTIKRLVKATGCRIEVPRQEEQHSREVEVQLHGNSDQRRRAAQALRSVAAGGDPEDCAGSARGALMLSHALDSLDKEFWLAWRLVPAESTYKVRVDVGRQNVRVWALGGHTICGASAEHVRNDVEAAIDEARELVEIVVTAGLEYETDYARYDPAVSPLVDKYGVLVHVPRPEDGCVPIRIVGPPDAARDAAELLEARYVKGRSTASVLQAPGQLQAMSEQMTADFDGDVRALEEECRVQVHRNQALIWILGTNDDSTAHARQTLREMLQFYFPEKCYLLQGLRKAAVEKLREDPELRVLSAKPDCALAFDPREGSIWICGEHRDSVQKQIDKFMVKWSAEHWEHDLSDYGAAMWLLGPRGTGDYLRRIQTDSGAEVKVCPNNLKVWAEGPPAKVKQAERLVMDALQRLEKKKETEGEFGSTFKPRPVLLSDELGHMKSVLQKLAELDEKKRVDDNRQRILERRREWGQEPVAERAADAAPEAGNRERSRSR